MEFPTLVEISEAELNLNQLLEEISLPGSGAACIFSGIVRGFTPTEGAPDDKAIHTLHLDYEAYPGMAEAKMRQVAEEMRQRWPDLQGIAIMQRVGRLSPGIPTVVIACSAGHRNTGVFEAARYGIDRLKEIVPIWKKEVTQTGEAWVEGEYIPGEGDLSA